MTMQNIITKKLKSKTGPPTEEDVYQGLLKELEAWESEFYGYGKQDG